MAIKDLKEFGERILNGVTADIDTELPKPAQAAWFGPNASLMFVELNKESPLDKYSIVIAIFHDDEAIRLYTLPAPLPAGVTPVVDGIGFQDASGKAVAWRVRAPSRMILTKVSPTYVTEAFPNLDVMADAIIDEWNLLGEGISSAEAELEAVCDYLETFGDEAISARMAIDDLRAGAHHEIDEDDDDDGEIDLPPVTPNPEPASPPAPIAVGAPAPEASKHA